MRGGPKFLNWIFSRCGWFGVAGGSLMNTIASIRAGFLSGVVKTYADYQKKRHLLALAALLSIPVVSILGAGLAAAIDPELAAGHVDYVRNFHLLSLARETVWVATGLADCALWLICCVFVLQAKSRSYWWLPFAALGPFGLAVLSLLGDRAPQKRDSYDRFVAGMRPFVRVAYEIVVFVVVANVAYQVVMFYGHLVVLAQSIREGLPVATIIDMQDASGGMWAFGEGLEWLFLMAVFYVFRPICFNMADGFRMSISPVSSRAKNPADEIARS